MGEIELKDGPLVSVIVPCYNYAHYLPITLNSVLGQVYENWECIVVDDGSTDNTREVLEDFITRDGRFRYLYKENGGLSSARNAGISNCAGDFIQFLDSDDLIERQKLRKQIELFRETEKADIVYSGVAFFKGDDGNNTEMITIPDSSGKMRCTGSGLAILNCLIEKNGLVVNAALLRKSVIDKIGFFDTELKSVEDWDFWLRCALAGLFFRYDEGPDSRALVRVHPTSMSRNVTRMIAASIRVREKAQRCLDAMKDGPDIERLRSYNEKIIAGLKRNLKNEKSILWKKSNEIVTALRGIKPLRDFVIFIKQFSRVVFKAGKGNNQNT